MISYKGKKIADAGFVINLPHRTDRKSKTKEILDNLGFEGYEFIDGHVFDDPEWKKFGCTQTYINIAEIMMLNDWEDIIIFEDDIKIMNGVSINDIDDIFDNWDEAKQNYDLISFGSRPLPGAKINKDSERFGRVSNTLCQHAWYYQKNFIEYMYNSLKNLQNPEDMFYRVFIDEFVNDCCSHEQIYKTKNKLFKVGITIPLVFTQTGGFSDIENSEQNYDGWIEYCYWEAIKNGEKYNKEMRILDVKIAESGYYVNLDKSTNRKENVEKQIELFKLQGLNRLPAVTDNPIHSSATSSQRKVFELCKKNGIETVLVLEDDFQLYDNVYVLDKNINKPLKEYLLEISNEMSTIEWDVIMLGFNGRKKNIVISKNFSINFKSTGAWGYIIKKNAYEFILDNFDYWRDRMAIDDILPHLNYRGFICLTTNAQVIHHADGFESTLQPGEPKYYSGWIDGNYWNSIWHKMKEKTNFDDILQQIYENSCFERENIFYFKNYPKNWKELEDIINSDVRIQRSLIVLDDQEIDNTDEHQRYLNYHFSAESHALVVWSSQLDNIRKFYNNIIYLDFSLETDYINQF